MKLYAMPKSGNCYKVAWALHRLQIPYQLIPTSFENGATKSLGFLQKNPNGQVPLLELDDGRRIAESNAILLFLEETRNTQHSSQSSSRSLIPSDPYQRAIMYQWMFFEQYTHEPAIAVRCANIVFQRPCPVARMQQLLEKGYHALDVMETQLAKTCSLVGQDMSLADVSLYAYTHVAHEGGYDMSQYPNIQSWLQRVRDTPGFCSVDILETEK